MGEHSKVDRGVCGVMPGKEYAIVVRAAESEEALCFVARPFSSDYDAIYDAIQVAAARCDLKPCTTIDFRDDKDFTQKFFQTIASAKLVIAVCSPVTNGGVFLANDNVMYELGIAHTIGKKTVILTSDSAHTPSDIRNRIFSKYSIHSADHQKNIETVERAIKTALAGAPEFLDDILKDDIWIIDSMQFLFAKNQFWKCFNNTISQIDKLFLAFSSFEDISVIPCRSQFNEMLRDPQNSLRIRQTFLDQWAGAARYYEQYIIPHVNNLKSASGNSILHNFKTLLELSRGTLTEKILDEAEQVWHFLLNDIESCHNSVDSFKKLAIYRNIIIRYAENRDMLVEQFNNIDLYTHAVNQKTALLLSTFRKMFSLGD